MIAALGKTDILWRQLSMSNKRVLVTGAGGFIGHHLVTFLKEQGHWVRGVDVKYPEFSQVDAGEFELVGWCAQ